jgi:adenine-specific DNA-methyltransferase
MSSNQKLELSWLGKGEDLNLEPRLLLLQPEHCVGSAEADNMLIHGDNLLALKALEQHYAGKVKCIYIDPPYNTGNAFEHYDDMQEHSLWLNLMFHRLVLLKNLLHTEGSIWISIDDDESHYLKVLLDEVFGRKNFVANVIWEKKFSPQNDAKWLSDSHDHILVYAKNKELWRPNMLPRTDEMNDRYKNPDNDKRGVWTSGDCSVKTYSATYDYPIKTPSGRIVNPPSGYCWRFSKEKFQELVEDSRIWFGVNGDNVPRFKRFLTDVKDGLVSKTIWYRAEVGDNQEAKQEIKAFNNVDVFATPKPERLIERVLTLATKEGDLVLDSFLGSGTTAAVAHKMGRKWIGIELGEHAYTHCLPRLRKVVEGSDQGGISKAVDWKGGGGFKVYKLAESLLERDEKGMLHINPDFTNEMVAEAVAKIEGYTYNPTPALYWQQGEGLDKSYLYVTKIFISRAWLDQLAEQVPEDVSLMVCCPAYTEGCDRAYKHIKLKKIPQAFQDAYDFDKGDYSLHVENVMPMEEEDVENGENTEGVTSMKKRHRKVENKQAELF